MSMSTQTYDGTFTEGTQYAVDNTNYDNGKIRVATDSKRLFFDLGGSRLEITDIVWDYTQSQLEAGTMLSDLNQHKIFLANDTGHVFVYSDAEDALVDLISFNVNNATHASTADYAVNAATSTYAVNASTADFATNAASATNASTASYAVNANSATNASTADFATNAANATSATNASTADYAVNASTADFATNAANATSATNASTASYATGALNDGSGNQISTTYAPLSSPALSGIPTAPTAATSTDTTQIATTAFVNAAILAAFENVQTLQILVVEELPETGVPGAFYFVPVEDGENPNLYEEYVWISNRFELLGSAQIDLTNYLNTVTEAGDGNAYTSFTKSGNGLTLTKGSSFLTAHPDIALDTNTTDTASPSAGGTFTVIDSVTQDANGHITQYNTKTITLPNSVATATHASTADYAVNAGTATFATNAGSATSATNASTATYATAASAAETANSATNATNASTATYAVSAGNAILANSATNASTADYAETAGSATSATNASTADYAVNAGSATSATNASTADFATSATNASTADFATSATNASTADFVAQASSATNASTADVALSASHADAASSIGTSGSTADIIPYIGNGGSTATAASTATEDCYNFDFGDIDSTDYYF